MAGFLGWFALFFTIQSVYQRISERLLGIFLLDAKYEVVGVTVKKEPLEGMTVVCIYVCTVLYITC